MKKTQLLEFFGLLFLVILVGSTTYIAANPNILQIISSQARCIDNAHCVAGMISSRNSAPHAVVQNAVSGQTYNAAVGSDNKVIPNTYTDSLGNPYTINSSGQLKLSSSYSPSSIINIDAAPNTLGYDCSLGGCPAGMASTDIFGYNQINGKYYPADATTDPSTYLGSTLAVRLYNIIDGQSTATLTSDEINYLTSLCQKGGGSDCGSEAGLVAFSESRLQTLDPNLYSQAQTQRANELTYNNAVLQQSCTGTIAKNGSCEINSTNIQSTQPNARLNASLGLPATTSQNEALQAFQNSNVAVPQALTDAQCGQGMTAEGDACRNEKTGAIIPYSDILLYNTAAGVGNKDATTYTKNVCQNSGGDCSNLQIFAFSQLKNITNVQIGTQSLYNQALSAAKSQQNAIQAQKELAAAAALPTQTISVTPTGGISIKVSNGGICFHPSDCISGSCGGGTCHASPQLSTAQISGCQASGGKPDLINNTCSINPQQLAAAQTKCSNSQGNWDSVTGGCKAGVPSIVNALTLGQANPAINTLTQLQEQYGTNPLQSFAENPFLNFYQNPSEASQTLTAVGRLVLGAAPATAVVGATSGLAAFGGASVISLASLGGTATLATTIANLPAASMVVATGALTTIPAWIAPVTTTALSVGSLYYPYQQMTVCNQYGFNSPQCAAQNNQTIMIAAGLQVANDSMVLQNVAAPELVANPSNLPDYYATLGVSKDATTSEIKAAFVNFSNSTNNWSTGISNEDAQNIVQAYKVLSNSSARVAYDQTFFGGQVPTGAATVSTPGSTAGGTSPASATDNLSLQLLSPGEASNLSVPAPANSVFNSVPEQVPVTQLANSFAAPTVASPLQSADEAANSLVVNNPLLAAETVDVNTAASGVVAPATDMPTVISNNQALAVDWSQTAIVPAAPTALAVIPPVQTSIIPFTPLIITQPIVPLTQVITAMVSRGLFNVPSLIPITNPIAPVTSISLSASSGVPTIPPTGNLAVDALDKYIVEPINNLLPPPSGAETPSVPAAAPAAAPIAEQNAPAAAPVEQPASAPAPTPAKPSLNDLYQQKVVKPLADLLGIKTPITLEDGSVVQLGKEITSGGQANIYDATVNTPAGPESAIVKEFRPMAGSDENSVFIREINQIQIDQYKGTQSSVEPKVFGVTTNSAGNTVVVMEKIGGVTVQDALANAQTPEEKIAIYTKTQDALKTLYQEKSVPHGDINTSGDPTAWYKNAILTPDGEVKLIDRIGTAQYDNLVNVGDITAPSQDPVVQAQQLENLETSGINGAIYQQKISSINTTEVATPGQAKPLVSEFFPNPETAPNINVDNLTLRVYPGGTLLDLVNTETEEPTETFLIGINNGTKQIDIYSNPSADSQVLLNDTNLNQIAKVKEMFGDGYTINVHGTQDVETALNNLQPTQSNVDLAALAKSDSKVPPNFLGFKLQWPFGRVSTPENMEIALAEPVTPASSVPAVPASNPVAEVVKTAETAAADAGNALDIAIVKPLNNILPGAKPEVPTPTLPTAQTLIQENKPVTWTDLQQSPKATIIDSTQTDLIPQMAGRAPTPQPKETRSLYPVEVATYLFFSQDTAAAGRSLVQDYMNALKNGEDIQSFVDQAQTYLDKQTQIYQNTLTTANTQAGVQLAKQSGVVSPSEIPTEDINKLALVRAMQNIDPIGIDSNGNVVIQSTFAGTEEKGPGLFRTSKHFTVNGVVAPVQNSVTAATTGNGTVSWSDKDVVIITPMNEFVAANGPPNTFMVQDTWWTPGTYNSLILPKGTAIIIRDGSAALDAYSNLPGMLIVKAQDPYTEANNLLQELGYQPKVQNTEFSHASPGSPLIFNNEQAFAQQLGSQTGLHFDSLTNNVETQVSATTIENGIAQNLAKWQSGSLPQYSRAGTLVGLIKSGYFSASPVDGLYIPPSQLPRMSLLSASDIAEPNMTSPFGRSQLNALDKMINTNTVDWPDFWQNEGVVAQYKSLLTNPGLDPSEMTGLPLIKPEILGLSQPEKDLLLNNVNQATRITEQQVIAATPPPTNLVQNVENEIGKVVTNAETGLANAGETIAKDLGLAPKTAPTLVTSPLSQPVSVLEDGTALTGQTPLELRPLLSEDGALQLPIDKPVVIKPGEIFDPQVEIHNILNNPVSGQPAALAAFQAKFNYQQNGLINIQTHLENMISQNPNISLTDLQNTANEMSSRYLLADWQKQKITDVLNDYVLNRTNVQALLKKYPDPKDLFTAISGQDPIGPVSVINGVNTINITMTKEDFANINPSFGVGASSGTVTFKGSSAEYQFIFINADAEFPKSELPSIIDHEKQHDINVILEANGIFPALSPDTRAELDKIMSYSQVTKEIGGGYGFRSLINPVTHHLQLPIGKVPQDPTVLMRNLLTTSREGADSQIANEILAYSKQGNPKDEIAATLNTPLYDFYHKQINSVSISLGQNNEAFTGLGISSDQYNTLTDEVFGAEAYTQRINDALNAYNTLTASLKYSPDEAIAFLQKYPLANWPKAVDRLAEPTVKIILGDLEFQSPIAPDGELQSPVINLRTTPIETTAVTSPTLPAAAVTKNTAITPINIEAATTDANGDPFTPLESVYNSQSPALARRISDVEGQVQSLTPTEISTILFDANYKEASGLYNQAGFTLALQLEADAAQASSSNLSVIAFKISNFKIINDSLGHVSGDQVLAAVSKALLGTTRATDVAARIGGNEFALILPNTPEDQAQIVVEKVLTAYQNASNLAPDNKALQLANIDFGISQISTGGDVSAFLGNLDNLIYNGQRATLVPTDLTQVTVAPDGDQFISLEGSYNADAPAIARRASDIEKGLSALTPEQIKAAIVQAKYIDPLTGIFNKDLVNDVIPVEMNAATQNGTDLSVAILDAQQFGKINDNFGRPEGDRALKEIADLLLKTVRPADIPARFGGDEFVLLLPGANAEQAKIPLQRFDAALAALKAANPDDPLIQAINMNYGVVQMQPGDTVETLLQRADAEMYAAKGKAAIALAPAAAAQPVAPAPQPNAIQKVENTLSNAEKSVVQEVEVLNQGALNAAKEFDEAIGIIKPPTSSAPPITPGEVFDPQTVLTDQNQSIAQRQADLAKLSYQDQGMTETQINLKTAITDNPNITEEELYADIAAASSKYGFTQATEADFQTEALNAISHQQEISTVLSKHPDSDEMYESMFGQKPVGNIDVTRGPVSINIRVYDPEDYKYLMSQANIGTASFPGGFELGGTTKIPGTSNMVIVIGAPEDTKPEIINEIINHETDHIFTALFNGVATPAYTVDNLDAYKAFEDAVIDGEDNQATPALTKFAELVKSQQADPKIVNEISAYIAGGTPTDDIYKILTDPDLPYDFYNAYMSLLKNQIANEIYVYPYYQSVIDQTLERVFGDNSRIKDALDAYNSMLLKGYNSKSAITTLTRYDLADWPTMAARAGQYVPPANVSIPVSQPNPIVRFVNDTEKTVTDGVTKVEETLGIIKPLASPLPAVNETIAPAEIKIVPDTSRQPINYSTDPLSKQTLNIPITSNLNTPGENEAGGYSILQGNNLTNIDGKTSSNVWGIRADANTRELSMWVNGEPVINDVGSRRLTILKDGDIVETPNGFFQVKISGDNQLSFEPVITNQPSYKSFSSSEFAAAYLKGTAETTSDTSVHALNDFNKLENLYIKQSDLSVEQSGNDLKVDNDTFQPIGNANGGRRPTYDLKDGTVIKLNVGGQTQRELFALQTSPEANENLVGVNGWGVVKTSGADILYIREQTITPLAVKNSDFYLRDLQNKIAQIHSVGGPNETQQINTLLNYYGLHSESDVTRAVNLLNYMKNDLGIGDYQVNQLGYQPEGKLVIFDWGNASDSALNANAGPLGQFSTYHQVAEFDFETYNAIKLHDPANTPSIGDALFGIAPEAAAQSVAPTSQPNAIQKVWNDFKDFISSADSEQGALKITLKDVENFRLRFPIGPNGLQSPIYFEAPSANPGLPVAQVNPPVTPPTLLDFYSTKFNLPSDIRLPALDAQEITSIYPEQQSLLDALQNRNKYEINQVINDVKQKLQQLNIHINETNTFDDPGFDLYLNSGDSKLPQEIQIPSIQAFQTDGYDENTSLVLYSETLLHEWGHILDIQTMLPTTPSYRFLNLTEARQFYFSLRMEAVAGFNPSNDAEAAQINQLLKWLGVPPDVLLNIPETAAMPITQPSQIQTIPDTIPEALILQQTAPQSEVPPFQSGSGPNILQNPPNILSAFLIGGSAYLAEKIIANNWNNISRYITNNIQNLFSKKHIISGTSAVASLTSSPANEGPSPTPQPVLSAIQSGITTLADIAKNADNLPLDFSIYMQRNGSAAKINRAGDTMLTRGCGPSTTYNLLRLTGHTDISINQIVDTFDWGKCGCATDPGAVLKEFQDNDPVNYKGAYTYGEANRKTNAEELNGYTGILVYYGTVTSPDESIDHIAGFDCQKGDCISIDSYFSSGKPIRCNVQSATSLKCGNYNYNVGETGGSPGAFYPLKTPAQPSP